MYQSHHARPAYCGSRLSYSYIPKPILEMLGDPDNLKFTVRDGYIEAGRPDE